MSFEQKRVLKIEAKIRDENLPLVFGGIIDFKNGRSKIRLTCQHGHSTSTVSIDNFMKRGKCPKCSKDNRTEQATNSPEYYIEQLNELPNVKSGVWSFVELTRYETKKKSSVRMLCHVHNLNFSPNFDNLLRSKGCKECGKIRTSESKIKTRDEHIKGFRAIHGDLYSYELFEWNGVHEPATFVCIEHNHPFVKTPANFRRTEHPHCPICADGVDINLYPTDIYVQMVKRYNDVFCKFGISIDCNRRRLQQEGKANSTNEFVKIITVGNRHIALDVERQIKKVVKCGYVSKDVFPDGFSETFNPEDLHKVLEILKEYEGNDE